MPCYFPMDLYKSRTPGEGMTLLRSGGYIDTAIKVPCGQCIGCRLEYTRQWAIRCHHESKTHTDNCFITLTYSDEHLPFRGILCKLDWQKFAQRLRDIKGKFRYMHAGEYGDLGRPHYHASIFGVSFADIEKHGKNQQGDQYYISAELDEIWGMGNCLITDLNFRTSRYVAQYMLKKYKGQDAERHYAIVDTDTGEYFGQRPAEYATMSNRPGIGHAWINEWMTDVYPADEVIIDGHPQRPPAYYDTQYEKINPEGMRVIKIKRQQLDEQVVWNNTADRRYIREQLKQRKLLYLNLTRT